MYDLANADFDAVQIDEPEYVAVVADEMGADVFKRDAGWYWYHAPTDRLDGPFPRLLEAAAAAVRALRH